MSAKQERRMRAVSKEHLERVNEALRAQRPWWFVLFCKIAPMWDVKRLLARPLARWKAKMASGNEAYRHFCKKRLSRTARMVCRAYQGAEGK